MYDTSNTEARHLFEKNMIPPLARSKNLWRDLFAWGSLSDADRFLCLIQKAIADNEHNLKWPLWIAFIVSYSRPFTSNDDMGSIGTKAIPKDLKCLHNALTKARDKLHGHTDPTETLQDGCQANQLIIRKIGARCELLPHTLVPADTELPNAKLLVAAVQQDLASKTSAGKEHLFEQLKNKADGDYLWPYPNLKK